MWEDGQKTYDRETGVFRIYAKTPEKTRNYVLAHGVSTFTFTNCEAFQTLYTAVKLHQQERVYLNRQYMERVKDGRPVGNLLLLIYLLPLRRTDGSKIYSSSVKRTFYSCLCSALHQPQNRCEGKCVLYT